jgi:hypothetical protein
VSELRATQSRPAPVRNGGLFLNEVVKPLYDVLRNEKGDIHTKFRNYDDINEFFWHGECLTYYYATPIYNVFGGRDIEGGADAHHTGTHEVTPSLILIHQHGFMETCDSNGYEMIIGISVGQRLKNGNKTYLERRNWFHVLRTFFRYIIDCLVASMSVADRRNAMIICSLFQFYIVSFHFLACLAFLDYK